MFTKVLRIEPHRPELNTDSTEATTGSFASRLLIDAAGLAKLLSCSTRHVRRMDSARELPCPLRLGRAVRWRLDEIQDWIEASCPDRRTWEMMRRRK